MKARLDVQGTDLAALRADADALAVAFGAHVDEFAAFKADILAQLEALRTGIYGDFESLKSDLYGALDGFKADVYGNIDGLRNMFYGDLQTMEQTFSSDITMLESQYAELAMRVQALEDEDVGTFKRKVLEMERSMAALAIKVDNNRAKLEGFDQAIASLSAEMATTKEGIMKANEQLLAEYDARIQALEEQNTKTASDISTLYFISIVALLAGVGALIWGFVGTN
jgi:chromosome segregation ATPase